MNKTGTGTVVQKHRTLWLSDLHLGSPGCKARELARFLRQNRCEQLYLVGDIIDGWKLKNRFYWTADHTRVIKAILAQARRGTQVWYLTGNHDAFMRQFVKNTLTLGQIRVTHERVHTTADGRRLLVQHGDRYDAVVTGLPGFAMAGDVAYATLLKVSDGLARIRAGLGFQPGTSLSAFVKRRVKGIVQYLSGFDEAVYFECQRRALQGVICGHTHHAEVRHIRNGTVSYNCGDWVESCTALAEDAQGQIRILRATSGGKKKISKLTVRAPAPRFQPAASAASASPAHDRMPAAA